VIWSGTGVVSSFSDLKYSITPGSPVVAFGLCWWYSGAKNLLASSRWYALMNVRHMSYTSFLFAASCGSLLFSSAAWSFVSTTGSAA